MFGIRFGLDDIFALFLLLVMVFVFTIISLKVIAEHIVYKVNKYFKKKYK